MRGRVLLSDRARESSGSCFRTPTRAGNLAGGARRTVAFMAPGVEVSMSGSTRRVLAAVGGVVITVVAAPAGAQGLVRFPAIGAAPNPVGCPGVTQVSVTFQYTQANPNLNPVTVPIQLWDDDGLLFGVTDDLLATGTWTFPAFVRNWQVNVPFSLQCVQQGNKCQLTGNAGADDEGDPHEVYAFTIGRTIGPINISCGCPGVVAGVEDTSLAPGGSEVDVAFVFSDDAPLALEAVLDMRYDAELVAIETVTTIPPLANIEVADDGLGNLFIVLTGDSFRPIPSRRITLRLGVVPLVPGPVVTELVVDGVGSGFADVNFNPIPFAGGVGRLGIYAPPTGPAEIDPALVVQTFGPPSGLRVATLSGVAGAVSADGELIGAGPTLIATAYPAGPGARLEPLPFANGMTTVNPDGSFEMDLLSIVDPVPASGVIVYTLIDPIGPGSVDRTIPFGAYCEADLTGDGTADIFDILEYFALFAGGC